jgi:hypothetical protein
MTVEIEKSEQSGFKKVCPLSLTLYKDNPYYVPSLFADELNTLRADKNPPLRCQSHIGWHIKMGGCWARGCHSCAQART